MSGRAGITRSQGWSAWLWRGSDEKVFFFRTMKWNVCLVVGGRGRVMGSPVNFLGAKRAHVRGRSRLEDR